MGTKETSKMDGWENDLGQTSARKLTLNSPLTSHSFQEMAALWIVWVSLSFGEPSLCFGQTVNCTLSVPDSRTLKKVCHLVDVKYSDLMRKPVPPEIIKSLDGNQGVVGLKEMADLNQT